MNTHKECDAKTHLEKALPKTLQLILVGRLGYHDLAHYWYENTKGGDPLVYWVRAWTVKRQIRGSNPGRRMLLLSYNLNKNNNITRGIPLSPPQKKTYLEEKSKELKFS